MTDNRDHVVDELAEYVLHALDGPGRGRVHAHVATCAACAERLAEYDAVMGALAVGLRPVSPPPEAWTNIRAGLRRRRIRGRGHWLRVARWPAAAAVVLLLLGWNVLLQRQLARYADGPQVEKLARRPGRLVILAGVTQPQASARLFAAVDGQSGHLAVAGLPPLTAGRVYQLWFRRAAVAQQAATFTVDETGRAWVVVKVPRPLEETDVIAITEEPAPGSPAPTSPHVLEATRWR